MIEIGSLVKAAAVLEETVECISTPSLSPLCSCWQEVDFHQKEGRTEGLGLEKKEEHSKKDARQELAKSHLASQIQRFSSQKRVTWCLLYFHSDLPTQLTFIILGSFFLTDPCFSLTNRLLF